MKGQHNTKKIKKLEIKTDNFKSGLDKSTYQQTNFGVKTFLVCSIIKLVGTEKHVKYFIIR